MGARWVQGEERKGSCLSVAKGLYNCFLSEDGFSSKALNTHNIGCFLSALTKALISQQEWGGQSQLFQLLSC